MPVPCELSIVNLLDDPTVNGLAVSAHNITQLRSTRDALERLATRDPLTGLPNRKLILDRIEQMQKRGRRTGHDGAVLFIDLDRFKDVNDSLGHRVGDDVLRQTAIRFQGALRESDSIGRLGGRRVRGAGRGVGCARTPRRPRRRLLESLAAPFAVHSAARPQLTISASIGIVSGAYASAEDLLMDADVALYEAKAAGRNRAMRFEPHMRGEFRTRIELERDLRLALEGEASSSSSTSRSSSCATAPSRAWRRCLRWRRPSGLVVAPDDFIPALEESGLIVEVGAFVLREACRQTRRCGTRRGCRRRCRSTSHPASSRRTPSSTRSRRRSDDSGLDPTSLILEMTETTLMRDSLRVGAAPQGPQGPRYPPRHRRLRDRLLVARVSPAIPGRHPQDRPDLHARPRPRPGQHRARCTLSSSSARALGLKTVAEGIETVDQLARLKQEGCDAGQGFYFSRPLESRGRERFLVDAAGAAEAMPVALTR